MNKLILNVKGQKLTRENSVKPVMNTDGLLLKVNFNDDNWNELDKEVLIIYNNEGVLRLSLNEEDEVAIPKECLLVNKIILAVEGSSVNFPCVPTTSLTVELDNSIHQAGYNELDLTGLIINQLNNAIASTGHTINYENTWLKLKDASGNEISQVQILGGGGESALVEMTATTEGIYWRYQGDINWNLLIAKADLLGPKGEIGPQGPKGESFEFSGITIADAATINEVLAPNVLYKTATLATCTSLTISLAVGSWFDEYTIYLTTSTVAPSISLPAGINWLGGTPTFSANKTYIISIQNGIGVVASV